MVQVLLVVFIMLNLCSGVSCKEILKDKLWYKNAVEYIKATEIMWQNAAEEKETFIEDYNLAYQAELNLFNSPSPTISKLEELINSQDVLDKKVALVTIVTKQIYTEELFKTILKCYDPHDDLFTKHYFYHSFNFLNRDKIRLFERDFIEVLKLENNKTAIITTMPTIIKIEPKKIIPFFVRYFKDGDIGLRRGSYVYLKKMGEEYLEQVKKILKEDNAVSALEFIKKAESGIKPSAPMEGSDK